MNSFQPVPCDSMKPKSATVSHLVPAWIRFYLYGMHGLLDEVVFTALFDLILEPNGNRQLKGYSTIFTFFIYGTGCFITERMYVYFYLQRGVKWYFRIPLYFIVLYTVELTSGLVLRQFDACSWDYSDYPLNFMGLITLVYLPVWAIPIVYQEWIADFVLSLRIMTHGYKKNNNCKDS